MVDPREVKFEVAEDIVKVMHKGNQIASLAVDMDIGGMTGKGDDFKGMVNLKLCGFRVAHTMWGCGIYKDGQGKHSNDMAFLVDTENRKTTGDEARRITDNCMVCFHEETKRIIPMMGVNHECKICMCKDMIIYPKHPYTSGFSENVEYIIYQKMRRMASASGSRSDAAFWANAIDRLMAKYGIKEEVEEQVKAAAVMKE